MLNVTKKGKKNPSLQLHVYYIYVHINIVNPVIYFVQNVHVYHPVKAGYLRRNNKSNLKSLRVILIGYGLSCCTSNECYISGFFWLLVGKDG